MSDTGSNCDNKPQQEDVSLEESQAEAVPVVENKPVTPVKRTPSKRLSAVERAQRESEELVKTLGGSLDIEGGRKTRSSTRGTPSRSNVVHTPPPTKRSRATTGTPKRGRGRKLETTIEDEIKTSPEKAPSEPESIHKENESSAVDDTKIVEKSEDDKSQTIETPSEVVEEKPSPAKQEDKPEAMEVDSVSSKETATESEKADESAQTKSESSLKPNDDELEKSDKVVTETLESSKATEEVANAPLSTDVEENASLGNENSDTAHENNVKANDIKVNSNSLPAEVSLPTPTPATQVSVAGSENKAESNDLSSLKTFVLISQAKDIDGNRNSLDAAEYIVPIGEPKIASPPITANNDGATPQYCN